MNTDKLISVIILAYNQENYIQDAINSVLNQNYPNIEIIVNDDCSSDKTVEKIKEIKDDRIRLIEAKYNQGINAGLDRAICAAKGEYIVLLGGDDMMTPDYMKKILQTFEEHSDIGAVYCNLIPIDEKNIPYKNIPKRRYYTYNQTEAEQLRFAFLYGNFVFSTGMAVKAKYFKELLPLPFSIVNNQDFKIHVDLIINGVKNIVLDDKLILYRVFRDKTNISSKGFTTELRESLEFEEVMESFLRINDIKLLEAMFDKEIKRTGLKPFPDTIPYFLGRMAIYAKKDAKQSWGYHKIIQFLKSEENFDVLKERYNLEYKDLLKLTKYFHNTIFQRCFKYKKLFNIFLIAFIVSILCLLLTIIYFTLII